MLTVCTEHADARQSGAWACARLAPAPGSMSAMMRWSAAVLVARGAGQSGARRPTGAVLRRRRRLARVARHRVDDLVNSWHRVTTPCSRRRHDKRGRLTWHAAISRRISGGRASDGAIVPPAGAVHAGRVVQAGTAGRPVSITRIMKSCLVRPLCIRSPSQDDALTHAKLVEQHETARPRIDALAGLRC